MPIFGDILFIHIPKTGGTSVEQYLSKKYDIPLNMNCVFSMTPYKGLYPQHYTYMEVLARKDELKIAITDTTKILTIVRNPYDRFIASLIYNGKLKKDTPPEDIYNIVKKIFSVKNTEVHFLPQYKFIAKDGILLENIIILKTEELNEGMHKNGWTDFNIHANKGNYRPRYDTILDNRSIELVREFYKKDFEYFNYSV